MGEVFPQGQCLPTITASEGNVPLQVRDHASTRQPARLIVVKEKMAPSGQRLCSCSTEALTP